jgi:hypothetical protein
VDASTIRRTMPVGRGLIQIDDGDNENKEVNESIVE